MSDEAPDQPAEPEGSYAIGKDGQRMTLDEWRAGQASEPPPEPKAKPTAEPTSPAILDRWPTPEENVRVELERYSNLIPGAAERLAKGMAFSVGQLSPEKRAEAVAKFMASPLAQRYVDGEASPSAVLPNGQPASPLRVALARYPELKPGMVDRLANEWAVDFAGKTPVQVAAAVVKRLGQRENAGFLRSPIDKAYEPAFGRGSSSAPAKPEAKAEPARQADGRFATPPTKPTRMRQGL